MGLNLKSIIANSLAVAAAVAIGAPLGNFVRGQFFGPASPLQAKELTKEVSMQQFPDATADYLILGDTHCNYCKDGIGLLNELGVKYRVTYLDKEPQGRALYEKLGAAGVPILISRQRYIVGFSKSAWLGLIETPAVGIVN